MISKRETSWYSKIDVACTQKTAVWEQSVGTDDDTFFTLEGDDSSSNNVRVSDVSDGISFAHSKYF